MAPSPSRASGAREAGTTTTPVMVARLVPPSGTDSSTSSPMSRSMASRVRRPRAISPGPSGWVPSSSSGRRSPSIRVDPHRPDDPAVDDEGVGADGQGGGGGERLDPGVGRQRLGPGRGALGVVVVEAGDHVPGLAPERRMVHETTEVGAEDQCGADRPDGGDRGDEGGDGRAPPTRVHREGDRDHGGGRAPAWASRPASGSCRRRRARCADPNADPRRPLTAAVPSTKRTIRAVPAIRTATSTWTLGSTTA